MHCVYVVDDSADLAWILDETLSQLGYGVVTAGNGLAALQQMRRQTPDLVVLDVNMPVMDGLTLARRLRLDPLLADVPILFLSVNSDFPAKTAGFRSGADDYMVKPFDLLELQARVEALLRRSSSVPDDERNCVRVNDSSLELGTGVFHSEGRRVQLTEMECDLLRYLMARADTLISAKELLEDVLDYPHDSGDPSAARWHIRNLRQKIEDDPGHPIRLVSVPPRGYLFRSTHSST